jgi:hypothetical protein
MGIEIFVEHTGSGTAIQTVGIFQRKKGRPFN